MSGRNTSQVLANSFAEAAMRGIAERTNRCVRPFFIFDQLEYLAVKVLHPLNLRRAVVAQPSLGCDFGRGPLMEARR